MRCNGWRPSAALQGNSVSFAVSQPTPMAFVRDHMTTELTTVAPQTPLLELRVLMKKGRFHHLIVLDGEALQGVLSDRDLLAALSPFLDTSSEQPRDVATLAKTADDLLKRPSVVVGPQETLAQAAQRMLDESVSALPVVEEGKVVGLLTSRDLLRALASGTM